MNSFAFFLAFGLCVTGLGAFLVLLGNGLGGGAALSADQLWASIETRDLSGIGAHLLMWALVLSPAIFSALMFCAYRSSRKDR